MKKLALLAFTFAMALSARAFTVGHLRCEYRENPNCIDEAKPRLTWLIAGDLKIEPCFLASRATLTAVARHEPPSIEKAMEVSGMMRWQAALLMPAIQNVLRER